MTEEAQTRDPGAAREALRTWALAMAGFAFFRVAIASWLPYGMSVLGAITVGVFVWLPGKMAERARREDPDWLSTEHWQRDVLFALAVMLVVFPPFVALFRGFIWLSDDVLPRALARWITPYAGSRHFAWRAPLDLLNKVGGNIAVALGEEYFYRGYMQDRLSAAWPARQRLLGVPFGRAALVQTGLFALGHLLNLQLFRLSTFFPGLLFTWMALRTGRVVASAIFHTACNLLITTLESSAFGPR